MGGKKERTLCACLLTIHTLNFIMAPRREFLPSSLNLDLTRFLATLNLKKSLGTLRTLGDSTIARTNVSSFSSSRGRFVPKRRFFSSSGKKAKRKREKEGSIKCGKRDRRGTFQIAYVKEFPSTSIEHRVQRATPLFSRHRIVYPGTI